MKTLQRIGFKACQERRSHADLPELHEAQNYLKQVNAR